MVLPPAEGRMRHDETQDQEIVDHRSRSWSRNSSSPSGFLLEEAMVFVTRCSSLSHSCLAALRCLVNVSTDERHIDDV
jgi:hypothetical protein